MKYSIYTKYGVHTGLEAPQSYGSARWPAMEMMSIVVLMAALR